MGGNGTSDKTKIVFYSHTCVKWILSFLGVILVSYGLLWTQGIELRAAAKSQKYTTDAIRVYDERLPIKYFSQLEGQLLIKEVSGLNKTVEKMDKKMDQMLEIQQECIIAVQQRRENREDRENWER